MTPESHFEMPNLDNATPELCVDEIVELRQRQKDLKKLEGIYTEKLKALTKNSNPDDSIDGKEFKGTEEKGYVLVASWVVQERFSASALKADDPELHAKYLNVIEFLQLKVA